MNYDEIPSLVKQLDDLLIKVERKLEIDRQKVIDSGFDPDYDLSGFWNVFRPMYDAYSLDIKRISHARHFLKQFNGKRKSELEEKYLIEFIELE